MSYKRIPVLPHVTSLKLGERRVITSSTTGRSIVVIRNPREGDRPLFFCMDALCYHMGGALGAKGDILDVEDIGPIIRCPEHQHSISLYNGALVQRGACAPINRNIHHDPACRKQRTHRTEIDAEGRVWALIAVNGIDETYESDKYNCVQVVGTKRKKKVRTLERAITLDGGAAPRKRANNDFLRFRARKLHATAAIRKKLEAGRVATSSFPKQQTIPSMFAARSTMGEEKTSIPFTTTTTTTTTSPEDISPAEYFRTFQHASS